jgi:Domain of unknown function (DUF5129)
MNIRPDRHRAVIGRVVALIALAVSVLFALPASAGALHTTDDAGAFTPSQLATVRSRAQGYDFDVRLITSSSYASKSDLGNYVHRFVTEPNLVVIGLDPVHRHVSVHFGTGTRIADSEFKTIESAGVASFKDADWAGGVVAILDRAERAVGTGGGHRAAPVGADPSNAVGHDGAYPQSAPSSGGFGGLFWVVAIVGVIGLVFWMIARRRASGPPPVGGYGPPVGGFGPPVGGFGPQVGGYGMPPQGPSYGGGSGLGGNIASAGLGGLVGYEIGKEVAEGHHHRYDDEDAAPRFHGGGGADEPRERDGGGDSAEPGNYDAGGASGDFDDSSDSGSSDGGDAGDGGGGGGDADF